jgi:hypothetical protein
VKNERAVLGEFLAHYRALGIERFAMIDNNSADATPDFLAAQPDVDLYLVDRPFNFKQGWINGVIARYGYDRWYVGVDVDEHIVFDGAGKRGFCDMIAFAEARGLRRVRGMLVDMYAPGPLLAPEVKPDASLAESFPLFDGDGYHESVGLERVSRKGGPRRRKFSCKTTYFDPELSKYPLFHIREGEVAANPHHIYPHDENYESDCFLGVLHYKFTSGFLEKTRKAVLDENYWHKSLEYKRYLAILTGQPQLSLAYAGTRAYSSPADLVASGLIEPIAWPPKRRTLRDLLDWGRQILNPLPASFRTSRMPRLRTSGPGTSAPVRQAARCSHSAD